MTTEKRLENLEKLVNALSKKIDNFNYYQTAAINGCRHSDSEMKNTADQDRADIDFIAMETGVDLDETI